MAPKKATVILFLCFSIIIAFFNILISNYQYLLFIIPFALGAVFNGRISKLLEIVGLYAVSFYILAFDNINMGLMLFVVSSVFVFTSTAKLRTSRIYVFITSAIIFAVSYLRFKSGADRAVHSTLDAMFFLVGSGSLYCVIYRSLHDAKINDKPIEQKYLDTLDELQKIARETIDMLKNMQGGDK